MKTKRIKFHLVVTLGLVLYAFQMGCSVRLSSCTHMKYLSLASHDVKGNENREYIMVSFGDKPDDGFFEDERVQLRKSKLSRSKKIEALEEYLCFYQNESISNRLYSQRYGRMQNRIKISRENIKFPVEVEALYSLTSMFFDEDVVISPVIINRKTGQNCNFERKDMDIVYKIYKNWFKEMKKQKFYNITWPLKNSDYMWLGEDVVDDVETLIKKEL